MKKLLFTMFLTAIISTFLLFTPTFAAEPVSKIKQIIGLPVFIQAEQTEWYFRTYNGGLQKRLWSITYGYWKTDWINV